MTAFALVILALVEIALVVFIVRFRRKKRARDVDGPQIHGSSRLETMWTVVPVVILFAIAAFVLVKLPGIKNVPEARAGTTNLVVRVTGRQYTGSSSIRTASSQSTSCARPRVVRWSSTSPRRPST